LQLISSFGPSPCKRYHKDATLRVDSESKVHSECDIYHNHIRERLTELRTVRRSTKGAASRQVVYEEDRRVILAFVTLQAAIIATSMVASGLGGASVLAMASRLM
jgi:hypothetical protein